MSGRGQKGVVREAIGVEGKGTALLSEFLDDVYLPWSKAKKSWLHALHAENNVLKENVARDIGSTC